MKKIIAILFVGFAAIGLSAQTLRSGYFVDNYKLAHNMNAAFASDQSYFAIPALNNFNVGIFSTLGVKDVFCKLPSGKTGTFLHPEVSMENALKGFKDINKIDVDVAYDIISGGFLVGKTGYFTLDCGVRVAEQATIPMDLFKMLKCGTSSGVGSYNISNVGVKGSAYAQLSLGYSMEVAKGLRLGFKVKPVVGLADVSAYMDNMTVNMSQNQWTVTSKASIAANVSCIKFRYDNTGCLNGFLPDLQSLKPSSYGALFDLGLSYTSPFGLQISASVCDVGFLIGAKNTVNYVEANSTVLYEGIKDIDIAHAQSLDFNEFVQKLMDDAMEIIRFREHELPAKFSPAKPAMKVFAGIKQSFVKDKMSIGVLYSGSYSLPDGFSSKNLAVRNHEVTVAYNVHPSRVFDFTLSYSFLNLHSSLGFLINFTPKRGLNIFLGSDYIPLAYTSKGVIVPTSDAILNVQFGLSVCFGIPRLKTE